MRYFIAILALFLVLATLAGLKASQISMLISAGEEMQKAGPPPETVSAAPIVEQTWENTLSTVASIVSARGVALSSDSPGVVVRIHFESGATVKAGQVLVELDTSVERAQLASTRAREDLAAISFKRSQALVGSGVSPQSQVDADQSSFKSLTADASALQAQIGRKTIRAPFSGRLGIREVNLGQYLAPGTVVSVLESAESVFVDFTLPQQDLPKIKVGMLVRATEEGSGGKPIAEGAISAIDPSVDALSRSVKLRATLQNQTAALRPGMFVRVNVVLPDQSRVTAVPLTAVVHASYGDSVFCVEDKPGSAGGQPTKVARQQFVRLGQTRGDFVAVLDGVKAGQQVVTAGAFKLRNGIPVVLSDEVKLNPQLAPRPENH